MPKSKAYYLSVLAAGCLFGFGLSYSQMTEPEKILAFLKLSSQWDPSMIFVMAAAVSTTMVGYYVSSLNQRPLFAARFHRPQLKDMDPSLVLGAGTFGVGWGLTGFCPGPAIVSAFLFDPRAVILLLGYLASTALYEAGTRRIAQIRWDETR